MVGQWNEKPKSTNLLDWVTLTVLVSEVFVLTGLAVVSVEFGRTKNKLFSK